ncbi:MAG: nitrilase [Deltaproteobacteria bacterium]|nr:nitrilase [Deltaproteobacteria bacterium]MBW2662298.1 nitrilase [Deltaproteobacteria bacterium]
MKDIRVAVAVFNSPVNKIRHNIDRMVRWVKEAKRKGASIICFPEMNVTGYCVHEDINKIAEPVSGWATQTLLQLAGEEKIVVLAGMAEKDQAGRIFASHLVIAPDSVSGVYRKLHIAPPERPFFTPGSEIPLFEMMGVKFGIQLCYDAHFPGLSTHMAVSGAELIFIPHASPRATPDKKFKSWMRHLVARAYDNSLFVIACNQTGENGKGLAFPGISVVIGPSGKIIKKRISGREGIMVVDLKADDLASVRNNRMHFFLPNTRADLY